MTLHLSGLLKNDASKKGILQLDTGYAPDIVGFGDAHLKFADGSSPSPNNMSMFKAHKKFS